MAQCNSTYQHVVQIRDVVKRFPIGNGEVTILKGISFDVAASDFVTIVGPSGNGKSTLLNMVAGIDRPSAGSVTVTGCPVHTMSENDLARWRRAHVGIIFQLDSQNADEMFALFGRLRDEGKTILMVPHDKDLANRVPRKIEIVDGQVARDTRKSL